MSRIKSRKWLFWTLSLILVIQLCFGISGVFKGAVFADEVEGTEGLENDAIDNGSSMSDNTTVTEYVYQGPQTGVDNQVDVSGNGLLGEYYNDLHFKKLVIARIDPEIDFNWGYNSPDPGINKNSFSVRWTGQVRPQYTGEYTFYADTTDGVRLWVNEELIIDEWRFLFPKESRGKIELAAGEKYNIRMEYQNGIGKAKAKLSWSCTEQNKQLIPEEKLFYTPKAPEDISTLSHTTSVALAWNEVPGAESYDIMINDEIISGISETEYKFEGLASGTEYTFKIRSVNSFSTGEWSKTVAVSTLEDQEAVLGNGNGLKGEYYDNIIFKKKIFDRVDQQIDFDWGTGTPDQRIKKNTFSTKWTGKILPKYTAKYTIYLYSDDGAKLWIDGKQLIDYWKPHNTKEGSATIELVAGEKHDIAIEYFNVNKEAVIALYWSNPYEDKGIIPMEQLYTTPGITENMEAIAEGSQIAVTWDNTPGAEGYELEVDGTSIDIGMEARYEHEALTPNSQHTYRVRAVNEVGKGDWSELVTKTSAPPIPGNITAIGDTTNILVSWDAAAEATGYDIEVNGDIIDNGDSTSYLHDNLSTNTEHKYRVRAKNENGISDWTEILTKTTLPATPGNVSSKATYNSITLSWDPVDGAISYEIEAEGQVHSGINGTSYTFEGLAPDTAYTYKVRARNIEGAGYWSEPVIKKTLLETPSGITSDITDRSVVLNWTAVYRAEGYEIEIDESDMVSVTEAVYADEGLLPNSEHSYRIRANNADNLSDWSEKVVRLTLPDTPRNVISDSTSYAIDISWEDIPGAISYDIEADGKVIGNTPDTKYVHKGLQPMTEYNYRIRAVSIAGAGYWSQPISNITKVGVPANISSVSTSTTITFTWDEESEADRYEIELDGVAFDNGSETVYEYTGLLPDSPHTYRVRSVNEIGYGDWSGLATKYTSPDVPVNISADSTSKTITLTWDTVPAASGYDVEVLGSPVDNGNSTVYTQTELNPNTQRAYRVRAKNENGLGDWSGIIVKSTLAMAPQNVRAYSSEAAIRFAWDAAAGALSYDVEADAVLYTDIISAEYEIAGLPAYSQHTLRVRSRNNDGVSDWSEAVTGSTLTAVPALVSAEVSETSVTTVWESVYGASGYDIEVDGQIIDCGMEKEYTHRDLLSNSSHTYRIRSKSSYGSGNWSEAVERLTLPAVPKGLITETTSSTVKLTWEKVAGAIGYDIEADGEIISLGTATEYMGENLAPDTEHIYRVRARSEAGAGNWSTELKAFTLFGMPQNIRTFASGNSIKTVWDEVYGVTGYEIEADGSLIDIEANTEYIHSELMPNTTHIYRIRARKDGIEGDWSERTVATTLLASIADIKAVSSNTTITINWTPIGDAESYDVEVDGSIVAGILEPVYKIEGLLPNTPHAIRVMAKSETNMSDWSGSMTKYTTPDIPANIILSATTSSITSSWDAVNGSVGYDIEVDGVITDNGVNTSYVHEGLSPNTQHIYKLRSRNEYEASEWSMEVIGTTEPELVFNIEKDNLFNFVIAAPKVEGVTERTITVTYNPEELEMIDLYAATSNKDIEVGEIQGSNIEVKEFTPGNIVFNLIDPGKAIMNAVKFKAKINGQSKILYVIE